MEFKHFFIKNIIKYDNRKYILIETYRFRESNLVEELNELRTIAKNNKFENYKVYITYLNKYVIEYLDLQSHTGEYLLFFGEGLEFHCKDDTFAITVYGSKFNGKVNLNNNEISFEPNEIIDEVKKNFDFNSEGYKALMIFGREYPRSIKLLLNNKVCEDCINESKQLIEKSKLDEENKKRRIAKEVEKYEEKKNNNSKVNKRSSDKYLTVKEYWNEIQVIKELCEYAIEEIEENYIDDIFDKANELIKSLEEEFKNEKIYNLNEDNYYELKENLEEIIERTCYINTENEYIDIDLVDNLLDFINIIIEEHKENTSRQYDRNYKPKRQEKRKNVKSEAKIKREKLYEEYRALLETGFTLEQIGAKYGKSKQAISNFLRRNEKLK